jgi:hypothetical protein
MATVISCLLFSNTSCHLLEEKRLESATKNNETNLVAQRTLIDHKYKNNANTTTKSTLQ